MNNTAILEVDVLQQQKTMSGFTSFSQEQKTEALVGTGSPQLDWKKNMAWSDKFDFSYGTQMVRSVFSTNNIYSTDLTCLVSTIQAGGGSVLMRGMFS